MPSCQPLFVYIVKRNQIMIMLSISLSQPHSSHWKHYTGLAQALKSPSKLKKCGISLKSPGFFHRSLGIFLKASWIKITFVIKSVLCKVKIERTAVCKFSWWSWKCVFLWFQCSCHTSFTVIWIPWEPHFPGRRYCNKSTPLHLWMWKVFIFTWSHSMSQGKEVFEKIFLVLEKCLIFPPNEPPFICTKY